MHKAEAEYIAGVKRRPKNKGKKRGKKNKQTVSPWSAPLLSSLSVRRLVIPVTLLWVEELAPLLISTPPRRAEAIKRRRWA